MNQIPPIGDYQASKQRFQFCAKQGLLKHAIATVKGGLGDSFTELVLAHEALGKSTSDSGLIVSINAHVWGALFPILNYGSTEQQQHYLADLLSATKIAGHAITEPQAGSDLTGLETKAEKTAEGLLLNGHKRYISNTPIADFLIVYALLDNKLSAFIVHNNDPGANFQNHPKVNACKTSPMGDVILQNCLIPCNRQLGKTGSGNMMIQQALELERAFIFAGLTGVMDSQLKAVVQFSRLRRIKGKHLGSNQAICHKIAEMKTRLDSCRLWVQHCAQLKDKQKRITLESAQTKLFAAEAFVQSSLDAVQIQGSHGLLEENSMIQLVNDALASRLFSGSSEIQKNIIAALLGTGDGYQ